MKIMYSAVNWINGNPVLDGMPIFEIKQNCLDFVAKSEKVEKLFKQKLIDEGLLDLRWTIIRLEIY